MKPYWNTPTESLSTSADVVIIGSGPGGSMAAMTLAESGLQVILLEKGAAMTSENMPPTLRDAVRDWYAESAFRTTKGTPPCPVAGGEGLGGGTLVNSALCFSTPERSLTHWNELSNGAFSDTVRYYDIQSQVKSVMQVAETPEWLLSGNDAAHKRGAQKLGWAEGNIHRNTPGCIGCARCNLGCPSEGKYSTDKGLLLRAANAGAQIITGCTVTHIKDTPNGVHITGIVRKNGHSIGTIDVSCATLVLSAGAIGTPSLLLDSGFGSINEHIGTGLHLQPVANTFGILPEAISARGATQGHYVDEFVDENILLESNPILAGAFFQSFPIFGQEAQDLMKRSNHFVSTGSLIRDTSEGRVVKPSNGAAQIYYDINDLDRQRLIKGLRLGCQIWLEGAGVERVVPSIFGTQWCRTMDDVRELLPMNLEAGALTLYASHPQASCRIGRACDAQGKLLHTNNIFVCDSSALPSNVGRNPQISIMTVARHIAESLVHIKGGTLQPLIMG